LPVIPVSVGPHGGARSINDFHRDLEWSLNASDCELLDEFYHRAFPHLERIEVVEDLSLQRQGIDKRLVLDNGKAVLVDEKLRRKDYGDILLEEYSVWEQKKVGWLGRHKATDYIVYAIMPSGKVYLLPFLLLQKAWLKHYSVWLERYGRKRAVNDGYVTTNIPVPTAEVLGAIRAEMEQPLSV